MVVKVGRQCHIGWTELYNFICLSFVALLVNLTSFVSLLSSHSYILDHFIHIYIAHITHLYTYATLHNFATYFVMATKVLRELVSLGEELGYDGEELWAFVKEEKECLEQEERKQKKRKRSSCGWSRKRETKATERDLKRQELEEARRKEELEVRRRDGGNT